MNETTLIQSLKHKARVVALVGASPKTDRDSYRIMAYLQRSGKRVIPVNARAAGKEILGELVVPDLSALPCPVDFVDVFLNTKAASSVVDQVVELGLPVVWLQLGVTPIEAAQRAEAAGVGVVMNRCPAIEWR
ncbi:MAG TPA: CoA-binding protein [Marinobacterium sp.]|nr:CoA-binding protein [Marinobacterium sp.]